MCGSYQWDVQTTVLRVAKSMRERGFRVWMDTEMMSGSTLDAMAAAVEGAHCVLICITERYKVRARRGAALRPGPSWHDARESRRRRASAPCSAQ